MNESDRHKPLYNIKRASQMSGISPNLIRAYERMGLLRPYREPGNNYRLFTEDEIEWLMRVKALINTVGLNIEGIKCVLTINPCWETRNCPEEIRDNCESHKNYNVPCWFVEHSISCCERENSCYNCDHYINVKRHPKLIIKEDV